MESETLIARDVTTFLESRSGRAEVVFAAAYEELRGLARALFASQQSEHTLQPTALVHEVWLKLSGRLDAVQNRDHFFALAALAMRQVLADHARRSKQEKRGGGAARVTMSEAAFEAPAWNVDLLELHDALDRFASDHPRAARVVELRAFGGLSTAAIALLLEVSEPTIKRDWRFARVWLARALDEAPA